MTSSTPPSRDVDRSAGLVRPQSSLLWLRNGVICPAYFRILQIDLFERGEAPGRAGRSPSCVPAGHRRSSPRPAIAPHPALRGPAARVKRPSVFSLQKLAKDSFVSCPPRPSLTAISNDPESPSPGPSRPQTHDSPSTRTSPPRRGEAGGGHAACHSVSSASGLGRTDKSPRIGPGKKNALRGRASANAHPCITHRGRDPALRITLTDAARPDGAMDGIT